MKDEVKNLEARIKLLEDKMEFAYSTADLSSLKELREKLNVLKVEAKHDKCEVKKS